MCGRSATSPLGRGFKGMTRRASLTRTVAGIQAVQGMSHIRLRQSGVRPRGRAAQRGFRPVAAAVAVALGAGFAAPVGARTLPTELVNGSVDIVLDGDSAFVVAQQA